MVIYKYGDIIKALVEGKIDVLAHGVNCSGSFGSGVAGQIAKRFPVARKEYMFKHKTTGWKLGDVQEVELGICNGVVVNCATQRNFGYDGRQYVDYDAIWTCLDKVRRLYRLCTIGMPQIGAGLAGGDWEVIEKLVQDVFRHDDIHVYIFDK